MKLLVEELRDSIPLSQEFTFSLEKRVQLLAFIPYIYMHNSPAGVFTLEISGPLGLIWSKTFNSSTLKTALNTGDDYLHGFIPLIPESPVLLEKGTFTATLSATGYVYNRGSFLGWIRQHENLNVALGYSPSNDAENPLAFRLKAYKEGIL